ncbi:MAG: hypothetical protein ACOYMU_07270 [Phycisphaerales bacterium]
MNMHAIYGLFAQGVIVAMIIRFVREIFGRKNLAPFGLELWIPAAIVIIVPVAGVSIAGHLRGLWGDPSIVTFLLLFLYTVRPSSLPNRPRVSTRVLVSLFVMLPLYLPLFLLNPNVPVDLYSYGWNPKWILIAIAVIAFVCMMMRRMAPRWINIIAIALIASSIDLMESDNLWDYLVDPGLLFTIAFLAIAGSITSFLGSRMPESIKNLSSGKQI